MQTDVDVLVVGAGACGLVAAIAAHDAGVGVAIIEKLDRPGGNSSLSTGSVPAAGTRFQREAGIADSTEQFVADLLRTGGPTDCPDLLRSLVATSAETVEWLVDFVGVRMVLVTAYKMSAIRCRGCTRRCRAAARIWSTIFLLPSKSAAFRSPSAMAQRRWYLTETVQ